MKGLNILILCLISSYLFGQNSPNSDTTNQNITISKFYILDEVWTPNSQQRWKTDDTPNFLQIQGKEAVLSSRWRNNSRFIFGEIDGLNIDSEGPNQTIKFYIRGREWSIGRIASIEIVEENSGTAIIHVYNKLGGGKSEIFYTAHKASIDEINLVRDYWGGN